MSILSVHDIQGISNFNNTVRVPSGHQLQVEQQLKIPVWTTPNRPTASTGLMGYNTSLGVLEIYDGTAWQPINQVTSGASAATKLTKPSTLDSGATSAYKYIDWNNTAYYGYVDNSSLGPATQFGTAVRGWLRVTKEEFIAWSSSASNIILPQGRYVQVTDATDGTRWNENQYDGTLAVVAFRLPDWVQGIYIEKWRCYSINGPDGQSGGSSVSDANIWNAFQGNTVSLGSNYATFEVSVATGSSQFARLYNSGGADGWTGEVNGGYLNLTGRSFTTYNGMSSYLGPTGKYLIFSTSDGTTETYRLTDFTFWIHG